MRVIHQRCIFFLITTATLCTLSSAKVPADESLQASLDDTAVGGRWIYNDWLAAQALAAKENKPILAMFR